MKKIFQFIVLVFIFSAICGATAVSEAIIVPQEIKKAETFSVRQGTFDDLPACLTLTRQVFDNIYRPLLAQDQEHCNLHLNTVDESLFAPFFPQKIGQLLIAENEQHQVVGCLLALPFFVVDKSPETAKAFEKIQHYASFEECTELFMNYCDGSGVYIMRFYIDEAWRGKGVGKSLLQSVKTSFEGAQKVYLDTYASNEQALGFYKHVGFTELERTYVGDPKESVTLVLEMNQLA